MQVCGRYFSSEMIARIQATVDADPSISRRALSRRVCQWLDWRARNGTLQEMSCRKALLELERHGRLRLPECTTTYAFQQPSPNGNPPVPPLTQVCCSLAELGPVEVVPVSSRYSKSSRVWNALLEEFHPLGRGPLCGAQVRYVVRSETHGWLGAASFSAPAWRLKARDEWIGWSEAARRAHLGEVVSNSRLLILPTVQVPNLASHVLSRCVRRLGDDWLGRYGYRPVLVETFVDPRRFAATTYRAANWVRLGSTAGRADPYPNGKVSSGPKDIYAVPLRRDWRSVLCAEPHVPLGATPRPEAPADWAEEEFGRVLLYDERLKARLFVLARDFYGQPTAPLPQACDGSEAKVKAAYRFFRNPQVDLQTLLRPHVEATVDRIQGPDVVLAVQDTTTLNYTAHRATHGLGPINTTKDGAVGLILHDTVAFTVGGTPLGVLDAQCWARDPDEAGKSAQRKALPLEAKESAKWLRSYRAVAEVQRLCPDTMLVSVGDREADLYELFAEAHENPSGPKLLVRAERTRQRRVDQEPLWDRMAREPVAGYQEVHIPGKGGRRARTATLAVRHARVALRPPQGKALAAVRVWAVYAREEGAPPDVSSPIEWLLLTTVDTPTFAAACERLAWYARRWGIEVYHRVIKSGCRIQDRRLGDADNLQACLAIDLVVGWRVYQLTTQGRETPDIPCDVFLRKEEWQALCAWATRQPPPATPPPLRQVVRWIGALGGFRGRKSDGEPGTTAVWRGVQRLTDITTGYVLGRSHPDARASP